MYIYTFCKGPHDEKNLSGRYLFGFDSGFCETAL